MSRTARRLGLAVAGVGFAALAAFATASPAAADNGPHMLLSGSMVSSADGCAGCHRMHGAKTGGDELFKEAAEGTEFCYTCHAGGTGATTNVRDGVSTVGNPLSIDSNAMSTHTSSYLNMALRGGGFDSSRVGGSAAVQGNIYYYAARNSWSPNKYAATGSNAGIHPNAYGEYVWGNLIPAVESATSMSAHTLEVSTTMWGSGTTSDDGGASVVLECINCHNPHGNGNYRILRPYGFEGDSGLLNSADVRNVFKEFNTITGWTAGVADTYNSGKFVTTITVSETPTVVTGQAVIVRTAGLAGTGFTGSVYAVDYAAKTISVGNITGAPALYSGAAYIMGNFPSSIVKAQYDGTTRVVGGFTQYKYMFTTAAANNMLAGQMITISTANNQGSLFAVKQALIETTSTTATTGGSTFTMWIPGNPANVGMEAGLYLDGIPDAKTVTYNAGTAGTSTNPGIPVGAAGVGDGKVYTTTNYFLADDVYYSGTYYEMKGKTSVLSTPFIANVSQWCSTCHTRYMSSNRKMSGVAVSNSPSMGTYKHQTASNSMGSPNCISCHVAHGTASKADGAKSSTLLNPSGTAGAFTGSALLRVDNRGVCLMCHNPYGNS